MNKEARLIYGKSDVEYIVSIEVENEKAYLFREFPDGLKDVKIVPNKFWVLAPYNLDKSFNRLDGDLYYKWGKQFTNRDEFLDYRKKNYARDIFSIKNAKEALMVKDGYTYFKGLKANEVSVLSFDIETVGLSHDSESKVLLISNTFRSVDGVQKKLFAYDEYENNGDMIEAWCKWVQEVDPSIIIGHNIFGFDIPYLNHCATLYGRNLTLGRNDNPIEIEEYESKFRVDGTKDLHYHKCHIWGREIIDTMFLSYRYDVGRKYESYGLKKIIAQEGLEKPGRVFYDASQIRFNYEKADHWEVIKEYCKDDADDALALYDLMIAPFFYMTQSVAKPFQMMFESATGGQINTIMMRAYLQDRHSLPKASEAEEYEGAISIGNPGIYRNVFKLDVASLYPSIMIQYEVFDKDKDPREYFKTLVSTFTARRLEHKKLAKTDKYYDDMQAAEKIFINSCYGFLGTAGLLFNSPSKAAFITAKGREILTGAIEWSAENNYTLVNCDTDSVSVCRADQEDMSEDEKNFIIDGINALTPDKISWEDDGFYPTFIVVKAKNYILWDGKKLKYKGSAIKATQKEPALKEFIQRVIDIILNNKETSVIHDKCIDLYNEYILEIMNVKDIIRWSHKKTITDKILKNERTNEAKVRDALAGSNYVEGDKIYLYYKEDGSLSLVENYNNDHDKATLLKKLYMTSQTFETILPVDDLFTNYSLKKKYAILKNSLDNMSQYNVG
jgi:DNA polymerase elongation subunit (family B)